MINFSIIIPHYNSHDSLKILLDSIPKKDDIQIIVVDDNSDSNLKKLKYNYKHVEFYINNSGNKGAGAARNIALTKAKGKWLIFADADDFFLSNFYSIISEQKNNLADIIYFNPISINKDRNNDGSRHYFYSNLVLNYLYENNSDFSLNKIKYKFVVPWSKMIKLDLVKKNNIKFDEIMVSNDVMFSMKTANLASSIDVINKTFYCVTESEGTLTTTVNKDYHKIRVNNFIERSKYLRKKISKQEYKKLEISGRPLLKKAKLSGFGIFYIFTISIKFLYNGVPLLYINKKMNK